MVGSCGKVARSAASEEGRVLVNSQVSSFALPIEVSRCLLLACSLAGKRGAVSVAEKLAASVKASAVARMVAGSKASSRSVPSKVWSG